MVPWCHVSFKWSLYSVATSPRFPVYGRGVAVALPRWMLCCIFCGVCCIAHRCSGSSDSVAGERMAVVGCSCGIYISRFDVSSLRDAKCRVYNEWRASAWIDESHSIDPLTISSWTRIERDRRGRLAEWAAHPFRKKKSPCQKGKGGKKW